MSPPTREADATVLGDTFRLDACSTVTSRIRFPAMRLYALVEAGDSEAIDIYLCEQDAQRALEDCLRDEPDWRGLLRVEAVELAEASPLSLN